MRDTEICKNSTTAYPDYLLFYQRPFIKCLRMPCALVVELNIMKCWAVLHVTNPRMTCILFWGGPLSAFIFKLPKAFRTLHRPHFPQLILLTSLFFFKFITCLLDNMVSIFLIVVSFVANKAAYLARHVAIESRAQLLAGAPHQLVYQCYMKKN